MSATPTDGEGGDAVSLERGGAIGRYVVLERLGKGAMGVVYAAYDPELDRRIALKLVPRRLAGDQAGGIMREAQAIARLNHPNVVIIHDVGTVTDAVFMAMECVDGSTLRQWLHRRRNVREIIGVFEAAGRGLLAAHRAGLVHADFKPDNVLVGTDGRVKVTDFGIARALAAADDAGATTDAEPSTDGGLTGTPAYMAPERFAGIACDAASDQFSFCASLYEALHGRRPFVGRTFAELALSISEGRIEPPPKDSSVPQWLQRVVVRGLRCDPAERYPDMQALLQDLGRDPARARRRMWLLGTAIVGSVASGWGLSAIADRGGERCRTPERLATVWSPERSEAIAKAIRATELSYADEVAQRAVARIDEWVAGWRDGQRAACRAHHVLGEQSSELFDQRMLCLNEKLAELSALAEVLEHANEEVAKQAARAVDGLPDVDACADAATLLEGVAPPSDPAAASAVEDLREDLARARALHRSGKYAEALELTNSVIATARDVGYPPIEAEAAFELGSAQEKLGDFESAQASLEDAYYTAAKHRHERIAMRAASHLVFVIGLRRARPDEALEWGTHAEVARVRADGGPLDEAQLLENLGQVLVRKGRFAEAKERFLRALELLERDGTDDFLAASVRTGLGTVQMELRELDEAAAHYAEAERIMTALVGSSHPEMASVFNGLGNVAYYQRRLDDAHLYYEKARRLWEATFGPNHPALVMALSNLGNVADDQGRSDEARRYYEQAVTTAEATLGPDHADVSTPLANLAIFLERAGEDENARKAYARALELRERVVGPAHPAVGNLLAGVGRMSMRVGDASAALETARRAKAVRSEQYGPDDPKTIETQVIEADALRSLGRRREAQQILESAWERIRSLEGHSLTRARTAFALARALPPSDAQRRRSLADQARQLFGAAGSLGARDLEELDTWLDDARR